MSSDTVYAEIGFHLCSYSCFLSIFSAEKWAHCFELSKSKYCTFIPLHPHSLLELLGEKLAGKIHTFWWSQEQKHSLYGCTQIPFPLFGLDENATQFVILENKMGFVFFSKTNFEIPNSTFEGSWCIAERLVTIHSVLTQADFCLMCLFLVAPKPRISHIL